MISFMKSLYCLIAVMGLLMTAAGCSLHPSMVRDNPVEVPPTYSTLGTTPAQPIGTWWEQFGDAHLNTLMEKAVTDNLDITQAYERLQQSQAVLRTVHASRFPVLNLNGSGGRARQASPLGAVTDDTYSLSAAASFELDLWEKLKSRQEAAQYDSMVSRENLKALLISTSAQLAELYYLAVEQHAHLNLSDQTIASFQDTLDRVERRYREGLVPAIDVYQSRQNLASAKAQRPIFEQTLATTLNAIAVLTGQFPSSEGNEITGELLDPPRFTEGIPSQLLSQRPDIASALYRLKASDERIGAAVADRFPSFNLVGTHGGTSEQVRTVLDSPNIFWNILLQAVQPLFDAGRRKAEVDRTEALFREHLAAYHKTVLSAFQDVEDALAKGKASEDRIRALEIQADFSESSLRLALDRYMLGLTDYLPVLTEQLRNVTSQSNLLAARRQLISDRIQLARALGGEWADTAYENLNALNHKRGYQP
jgi:NodT family efflux transporter outer membrane factor (OMF) lipoprotein